MLVENNSLQEIRDFRDRVLYKVEDIKTRWLLDEINKFFRKKVNRHKAFSKSFKIENQTITMQFTLLFSSKKECLPYCGEKIFTYVETKQGKMKYLFNKDSIRIHSPHYMKRNNERIVPNTFHKLEFNKVKYKRNNKEYILEVEDHIIRIGKELAPDIFLFITCLHKDMCTSKNYQELFTKINTLIDTQDIYEWK